MQVDSGSFPAEWERCREFLRPAIAYADNAFTERSVLDGLLAGRFQLWPASKSAVVTQIIRYPKGDVCRFFLAGGDLEELRTMEAPLIAWAKAQGCYALEIAGRDGWVRALGGYRKICTIFWKELDNE